MSFRGMLLKAGIYSDGNNVDIPGLVDAGQFGNKYYVDYANGDDQKNGQSRNQAFKTLSRAIEAVTNNNNDIIYVSGNATVKEPAMVTLDKNRVHIVGVNGTPGHYGAGAKIDCIATTGATNLATFKNTGIRNTFTGIKFVSSMTITESLYGVIEAGEYARYFNCEFYKSSHLNITGAAELLLNGDSAMFYNCTLGSLVHEISGDIIRPVVLCTSKLTDKYAVDCYFENCLFFRNGGSVANRFIYGANATDIVRMLMIKDSEFINNIEGTANPGAAVAFGAAQTKGIVALKNCSAWGVTLLASAAVGIYVDGTVPTFATSGVAVAS